MTTPLQTADGRRTVRMLGSLIGRHRGGFALAVLVLALGAAAGVASPLVLGGMIDAAVARDGAGVRMLLVLLLAAVVVQAALAAASHVAVARVGERILAALREQIVAHVLRLPERRVEAAGRGELVARVSGDVAVVGETVSAVVPRVAGASFAIAAAAVGLGAIDLRLTLAACLAVPVQWLALRSHLRRSMPVYRASRAAAGERSQRMLEGLDAQETLTAFGITGRVEVQVDAAAKEAASLGMKAVGLGTRFSRWLNTAELVGVAAVLVVGFLLVGGGEATVGAATAAALMFLNLFGPMGQVLDGFDDLQRASASLSRLVGVLDEPAEAADPAADPVGVEDEAPVEIVVEGVSYAYGDVPVLADVTLRVAPGEHLAVVGASGAGKSTLASLLCGRLAVQEGNVELRGSADPRVALVTQENHVFAGTLAEDLRLADPAATDEQLRAALAGVGAEGWVSRLEDGIAATIGAGGVALTDVQRQQLALARVALFDPRVLVLDEAASEAGSLDGDLLDRAALSLARGRTAVTIAHRLEQARSADRIIVMDAGRIVEQGTHAELLSAGGAYARLWTLSGH
ncbi:ABC transporter ATP-binding protein [Microbacterium tumbae]